MIMDYTMDTLSMENVVHGEVVYSRENSAAESVQEQHDQQPHSIAQDIPIDQQYTGGTTLPQTSIPVNMGQAENHDPQLNPAAIEIQAVYGMQTYANHPAAPVREEPLSNGTDQSNTLATPRDVEPQQMVGRQGYFYSNNASVEDHQTSSVYSEADRQAIESMETGSLVQEGYEPVVSDFLPETQPLREAQYADIRGEGNASYREAVHTDNISHPVNSQNMETSHQNHSTVNISQSSILQEISDRRAGGVGIVADSDRMCPNNDVGTRNSQEVVRNEFSLATPADGTNKLAQSVEMGDVVSSLGPQLSATASTAVANTESGESFAQETRESVAKNFEDQERQTSNASSLGVEGQAVEKADPVSEDGKVTDDSGPPGQAEIGEDMVAVGTVETAGQESRNELVSPETSKEEQNRPDCPSVVKEQKGGTLVRKEVAAVLDRAVKKKPVVYDDDATRSPQPIPKFSVGRRKAALAAAAAVAEDDGESVGSTDSPATRVGTRKRFKCKMCQKAFRLKTELKKHMKTHSKAKKKGFPCTECTSSFTTKAMLIKHLKTHENKPYTCNLCPTTFHSLVDLKDHKRIHSDVRAFSCTECSYSAKRQKDLRKHMLVHTESKVHNCQFCKFSSKRKYSLQRHMKNSHSSAQVYECTICNFKTSAVDSFKVHVAMHASTRTTSCILCGAIVKKRPNLIEHLLGHSNDPDTTCKECDEAFPSSHEYMLHLLGHKEQKSETAEDGNASSVFDMNSSSLLNGSMDSASGAFGFMARKCKRIMDTPTMESSITQMSGLASRLADMTKVVSLLNEKSKVVLQLGEISGLATELAVMTGNLLQSYKNMYNIPNTNSASSKATKAPSTSSDAAEDSSFMADDSMTSMMNLANTAIKQELQDSLYGAGDAGMQIQVDINGEPISCVQKEDSSGGTTKSKSGEKQLKCTRCQLVFSDTRSLKRHMMAHDDVRPYSCEKCGQSFRRNEHLKKHMVTHSDERPFVCKECTYAAKTEHRLKIHMLCHSQTKNFACQHCNYTARTNYELNHHMKKHEPRTCTQCSFVCYSRAEMKKHVFTHSSFDCNECEFSTNDRTEYTKHMKKHSLVQHLCCELCGYSCDTMKKFKYHKLRHENKTPFQCPDCDYKCSSRASYDCHRLKHAGLKPYLCSFCGAAFRKTSHLNQHLLIHKDEKAFKCSECGYSCRTKHNLKEHEMTHSGEKPFACKYCSFSCRRNKALQLHMLKHENQGMMMPQIQMPHMQMPHMQMPMAMPMMPTGL